MAKLEDTKGNQDNAHAGITQDFYNEKAAQSKENRLSGGSDVEINLTDTHTVKFKQDFGFMKKDVIYTISEMAYQVYDKKKLVEKV